MPVLQNSLPWPPLLYSWAYFRLRPDVLWDVEHLLALVSSILNNEVIASSHCCDTNNEDKWLFLSSISAQWPKVQAGWQPEKTSLIPDCFTPLPQPSFSQTHSEQTTKCAAKIQERSNSLNRSFPGPAVWTTGLMKRQAAKTRSTLLL